MFTEVLHLQWAVAMKIKQTPISKKPSRRLLLTTENKTFVRGGRMKKVAGVVVSYAPTIAAGIFALLVPTAAVACVENVPSSGVFVCNTDQTTSQSLSATGVLLDVTVSETASFDSAGEAFRLDGDSGISFEQGTPGGSGTGIIRGTEYGIRAGATGGDVNISVVTDVGGGVTEEAGIAVVAYQDAGSVTVQTGEGNLYSQKYGFVALSYGSGGITFNGGDSDWIQGGEFGIKTTALGDNPDTTITVQGAVIGELVDGISAQHGNASYETGGDITIQTGDGFVTGNRYGISAVNFDDGDVNITGGAGAISGGERGVNVKNSFTGSTDITVEGAVTGTNDSAIYVNNGPTIFDIILNGAEYGPGTLEITTGDGAINAGKTGIEASNTNQGGITVTTGTGAITGDREAIAVANIFGGSVDINVNADLTATGTNVAAGTTNHALRATNGIDGDALTITVASGVEITATGGGGDSVGILAASSGSGDVTLDLGSVTVRGGESGLDVANRGADINVGINGGYIYGGFNSGIYAQNYPGAGNISISTGSAEVVGEQHGINVLSRSPGNIDITTGAGGSITGNRDAAIFAYNRDGSDGNTTITIGGEVLGTTGATQDAVQVINEGTGDATVTSLAGSNVTGADNGIDISNNDGDVVVDVDGAVTGTTGDGIAVVNGDEDNATDGSVNITTGAGEVFGGDDGIDAVNFGTGDLNITTGTGEIIGVDDAIYADNRNGGSINIVVNGGLDSDTRNAIFAANATGGDSITIKTYGNESIFAAEDAIAARNSGTGGVTLDLGEGFIGAQRDAVKVINRNGGDISITVDGGNGGNLQSFGRDGIYARNYSAATGGAISIVTGDGYVRARRNGITARNADTGNVEITGGAGFITSRDATAILAESQNGGDVIIDVIGNVTGGSQSGSNADAIRATNSGSGGVSVTSGAGNIVGRSDGIDVTNTDGGTVNVAVEGAVTGASGDAISVVNGEGGTTVGVSTGAGAITGGQNGIDVTNEGTGGVTVQGGTGAITGTQDAILVDNTNGGAVSVTVSGAVTGTNDYGIDVTNGVGGSTLSVTTGAGAVTGGYIGIGASNDGTGDLFFNYGQAGLGATGAITGGSDGVVLLNQNGGSVRATTVGDVTGVTRDGVRVGNNASALFVHTSAGEVDGGRYGVYAYNEGSGTLRVSSEEGGSITGGVDGIKVTSDNGGAVQVAALGAVTGETEAAIDVDSNLGGDLVTVTTGTGAIDGATNAILVNNTGDGGITIDGGTGAITSDSSSAIQLSNQNGGNIVVAITGDVTSGGGSGIQSYNSGDGDTTSVSVSGDQVEVTGTQDGIRLTQQGGQNLSVTTAAGTTIGGGRHGINAFNNGAGTTTINVDGAVTASTAYDPGGSAQDAIYVSTGGNSTTLSITTGLGNITGARNGISATHFGDDELTIQTGQGAVQGVAGSGIVATNNGSGDLNITGGTGAISGANNGVYAKNSNGGATSVSVSGGVTGTTNDGINASNGVGGSTLSVTTGAEAITGGQSGIVATHFGDEDLTVLTGEGAVEGYSGNGIFANSSGAGGLRISGGTGAITGARNGIFAQNTNGGAVDVSVSGSVTGSTYNGINAVNGDGGSTLSVTTGAGDISGARSGIVATKLGDEDLTIQTGAGAVEGSSGNGIVATISGAGGLGITGGTGAITGSINGIFAQNTNGGAVDIGVSGDVTGTSGDAISAINGVGGTTLTIETGAGTIQGDLFGIEARNSGTGDLQITGGAGEILGTLSGVYAKNYNGGDTTVSVTGDVTGTNADAIFVNNSGTSLLVETGAGEIQSGRQFGINAINVGDTSNAGSEDLTVRVGTGKITSYLSGVATNNQGEGETNVSVEGAIEVTGLLAGINVITGFLNTDTNVTTGAGDVTGGYLASGVKVLHQGTGTLTITGGEGTITGDTVGIEAENQRGLETNINVTHDVTGQISFGISALNSGTAGTVSISTGAGEIYGGRSGIYARDFGDGVSITGGSGEISGGDNGVEVDNFGVGSTNIGVTGDVIGDEEDGIYAYNEVRTTSLTITTGDGVVHGRYDGAIELARDSNGIDATNKGSGDLTVTGGAGTIAGADNGIALLNRYGGAIYVNVSGEVIGKRLYGINAVNEVGGSSVTVITGAGSLQGGSSGINALNLGTGDLIVEGGTGSITGYEHGLKLRNFNGGDVIASVQGDVNSSLLDAISIRNTDGRYTSITTGSGAVSGYEAAILVESTGTEGITVKGGTGALLGGTYGITAENENGGAIDIDVTGDVTGTSADGIYATNDASGTSVSVTTGGGSVQGGEAGVSAKNSGTGDLTFTGGAGAITGGTYGVDLVNTGSGDLTFTGGTGAITGGWGGIILQNQNGGAVSASVQGDVTGVGNNYYGIVIGNGVGGTSLDLTITDGSVQGGQAAVFATNRGTGDLTITGTGDGAITGSYDGIQVQNYYGGAVSISVEGDVTGTRDRGIFAANDAAGTSMTISTGAGAIEGGSAGVTAINRGSGGLTFTGGSGSITGEADYGVVARNYNGGDLNVSVIGDVYSGTATSGTYDALNVINGVGGGAVTLTTGAGTISSGTDAGIQVTNRGVGDLVFEGGTGLITGRAGLVVSHANTGNIAINVRGDVTATNDTGISVSKTLRAGDIDISLGAGTINANLNGVLASSSGGGDISVSGNGGAIQSGGEAVDVSASGGGNIDITLSDVDIDVSGGTSGINTDGTFGSLTEITLNSGTTLDTVSGIAISNTLSDSDVTVNAGAVVNGAIQLGLGSDTLTFNGSDINAVTIFDGGDDVSNADGYIDTLNLNGVSGVLTGANLIGWENINLANGSVVSFADSSLTAGRFALNAGTQLNFQNNAASDEFTLNGDFSGGGIISVDVDFATDTSDLLTVAGDVTGDTTTIALNDISSGFATGNDVVVVSVAGDALPDSFALEQPVRSGVFLYDLEQQGSDFVLENTGNFASQVTGLEALGYTLLSLNELAPLRERMEQRELFGARNLGRGALSFGETTIQSHLWVQVANSYGKFTPESSATDYGVELTNFRLRTGIEFLAYEERNERLSFGVNALYGDANAQIASESGNGNIDTRYVGVGLTSTWRAANGLYVDGQVQYINYMNEVTTGGIPTDTDGDGFATSVEVGKIIALQDSDWVLTPSGQLTFSTVGYDDFTDGSGLLTSADSTNSLKARLGLSGDKVSEWQTDSGLQKQELSVFGNLYLELDAEHEVSIAGAVLESSLESEAFEVGIGYTRSVNDGRFSAFARASFAGAIGDVPDNYSTQIKLGGQIAW